MMPAALPNLITELDVAVKAASPERGNRMLQEVTSLFLSNVERLGTSEISVLDDILARLVAHGEPASLVSLSEALSKIERAPNKIVRRLALHEDLSVAAPLLRSSAVSQQDLLEAAKTSSQQHLLTICERRPLNEALTDELLKRGDSHVFNALANNQGAAFSEWGYATLIGQAEGDEGLLEKLGLRLDTPAVLLRKLLAMATDVVRARFLTASRTANKPVSQAAPLKPARSKTDYTEATSNVVSLNRTGKLNNSAVNRFAVKGEYTYVLAALAFMAEVKVEVIEPFIASDRLYALIVTCKAARLDWSTVSMIVRNRPGCPPVSQLELEQSREIFDHLLLSIAQWTVRFASDRI